MGGAAGGLPADHRRPAVRDRPAGGPDRGRRGDAPQPEPARRVSGQRTGAGAAGAAVLRAAGPGAAAGGFRERAGWAERLERGASASGGRVVQRGRGAGADRGTGHRLVPGHDRPGGRASPGRAGGRAAGVAVIATDVAARVRLAVLPTPLVLAPRLGEAVGADALYVKRDDLTGFAFAGNKARPLEFLVAAALGEGADTLVTGGAAGSNFCAAAAAAAARAGLGCELVIAGHPGPPGAALALARSWGAAIRWTGVPERDSVDAGLPAAAAELAAAGRRPYVMPRGGASGLGAAGYALAAFEVREQLAAHGIGSARVVVAAGSGGTLAGLVAGNVLAGRPLTLIGAAVSRPADETARRVLALARECLRMLGGSEAGPEDVMVADARGPGHGLASPEGTAAAEQAMRTEGLMVDPVYTAKALALVGRYAAGGNVVFWHTGGQLDVVALGAGR